MKTKIGVFLIFCILSPSSFALRPAPLWEGWTPEGTDMECGWSRTNPNKASSPECIAKMEAEKEQYKSPEKKQDVLKEKQEALDQQQAELERRQAELEEKTRLLEEKIEKRLNEEEMRAKQELGAKAEMLESFVPLIKAKDATTQAQVKGIVEIFKMSEDAETRNIGIYLSYVLR